MFDQMRSNRFSPNPFTFELILSVCERTGFGNDASKIFNLMLKYKIEASKEHFAIMVRLHQMVNQLASFGEIPSKVPFFLLLTILVQFTLYTVYCKINLQLLMICMWSLYVIFCCDEIAG